MLTDGEDNSPSNTEIEATKLSNSILLNEVYAKFSVIGIGEHEVQLFEKLLDIGAERGIY